MFSYLLVELDVLQDFDGLIVIAQQRVKPQQSHQTEISQHLIERVTAVFSSHGLWVTCDTNTSVTLTSELDKQETRHEG